MRRLFLLACLFVSAGAAAATDDAFDAALKAAKARHAPVLVDFSAPWCYSCYYMKSHVLTGPEWDKVEKSTVVIELDADAPDGARYMKEWSVKALPTYVLFNADGAELGRLLAEQTRADFYK